MVLIRVIPGLGRSDLELAGDISNGAQDLVLDLSFQRYRAGAAPRNWHRNGVLLHPAAGNPDKAGSSPSAGLLAGHHQHFGPHSLRAPAPAVSARAPGDDTLLQDFGQRASATKHPLVYLPPRCFLQHSQGEDKSRGNEGRSAPDEHQHQRPPAPDQETWQTSSKLCAPHILTASCAPHCHLPVT